MRQCQLSADNLTEIAQGQDGATWQSPEGVSHVQITMDFLGIHVRVRHKCTRTHLLSYIELVISRYSFPALTLCFASVSAVKARNLGF